jgi:hypothetical protein
MSAPMLVPTRAKIFLSYSTKDTGLAENLLNKIQDEGIECFYAPADIPALREWRLELEANIRTANVFLLLYTSASSQSEEVQKEVEQASVLGKEIWPIREISATITPFFQQRAFKDRQAIQLRPGEETHCFEQIQAEIDKLFPKRGNRGEITRANCPYPGPQPFSSQFDNVFFGRREAIVDLTRAIQGKQRVLLVYGPSGAGKTSLLSVGIGRELRPWCFYSDPISGTTAYGLLRPVLARVSAVAEPVARVSDEHIVREILEAISRGEPNRYVLCFDQMENFFTERAPGEEIEIFLRSIQTLLARASKQVTVLISFRKESLADVQPQIKKYFKDNWDEQLISKLSTEDALQCVLEPAALRGVTFDLEVADALVRALAKDEPTVNPMDIQKVCIRLWEQIAQQEEGKPHWKIDDVRLERLSGAGDLQTNADRFVGNVLAGYLRERVSEIALKLPPEVAGPNPEEYVKLSLMQFVGPEKVRLPVPETVDEGERLVGKLSMDVVKELVNSGLVQSAGSTGDKHKYYELAHDSLAVEIANYGEKSPQVFAVKSLDSVLSRNAKDKSTFNQHSELLENLEDVRDNKWPFKENETEFLVRCALGDKRRNTKKAVISLDAWAQELANKSPGRLVKVLEDGLAENEESVQLDVMELLPKVRSKIDSEALKKLGARIQALSMDEQRSRQVREKACSLLVNLGYEPGIDALFACFGETKTRAEATTAVALVRHAIDTLQGTSACFQARWRSLGFWSRLRVLAELFRWRWDQSSWSIFYIVSISAPCTAIGAIIPFIPLGHFGASLTMEDTNYGLVAGIFHGATGGLVWGFGVTAALLAYCVIWRGGRIHHSAREAFAMSLWASVGGMIGGWVNAAVVGLVFVETGLYTGGWLDPNSHAGRVHQLLIETKHGWIMPVFGAVLGIGIGWSMTRILSDRREGWIVRKDGDKAKHAPSAASGPSAEVVAKDQDKTKHAQIGAEVAVRQSLKQIVMHVLRESWRNALWLAIGAVLLFFLIHPASGVCDPSDVVAHGGRVGLPAGCVAKYQLPPKWVRTAGLAVVILGGSILLEIGFLFSLLSVQFGLDFRKNLKENRYFLRSAGVRDDVPIDSPPRVPAPA